MAIKCEFIRTTTGVVITDAHAVIGSFVEVSKGVLAVNVNVWITKQSYLDKLAPIDSIRLVVNPENLDTGVTMRAALYACLMQQPEFINPVADMADDFPVTPIE